MSTGIIIESLEKKKKRLEEARTDIVFEIQVKVEQLTELNYEVSQLTSKIRELDNLLDTLKSTFAELFVEELE